jgi:pyruvate/2-oxoglutarate dehydrogenase complex dihydrolipoamide dehydrogenase (E3) component
VLSRKRSDATDHYDLVVIGGGTGGLISARVGAGIGARVALVERGRLGGDCLWTGCVPSKSLLAAAELAHRMRHADRVGLTPVAPEIDFSRVMDHVRAAQRIIAPQDSAQRLSRDGIDVVIGDARFVSPGAVEVAGRRLRFRKAIIATGSHPALPPVPGLDDVAPLTSDSVWDLQRAPGALAVLGAGRAPSTSDLGLEAAGVVTDARGHVGVDGRLRTSARHIYAVGDVTGAMAFTHVAAYHARVATVNALFAARRRVEYGAVPRVCFTDPPVARVGLTAAQAQARWGDTTVTSFDYAELDRAITDGRTEGFATLIGDPKGRLVGATIAAAGAAESIAELTAWIALGAKLDRVSQTVHAYPTLSEGPSRVADERLRARYATPRVQYLARGALRALAAVDRPG